MRRSQFFQTCLSPSLYPWSVSLSTRVEWIVLQSKRIAYPNKLYCIPSVVYIILYIYTIEEIAIRSFTEKFIDVWNTSDWSSEKLAVIGETRCTRWTYLWLKQFRSADIIGHLYIQIISKTLQKKYQNHKRFILKLCLYMYLFQAYRRPYWRSNRKTHFLEIKSIVYSFQTFKIGNNNYKTYIFARTKHQILQNWPFRLPMFTIILYNKIFFVLHIFHQNKTSNFYILVTSNANKLV